MILQDVDAFDPVQQQRLLRWLDEPRSGRTQVISLTATRLYNLVQAGTFSEPLYYRLNLTQFEVLSEEDRRYACNHQGIARQRATGMIAHERAPRLRWRTDSSRGWGLRALDEYVLGRANVGPIPLVAVLDDQSGLDRHLPVARIRVRTHRPCYRLAIDAQNGQGLQTVTLPLGQGLLDRGRRSICLSRQVWASPAGEQTNMSQTPGYCSPPSR